VTYTTGPDMFPGEKKTAAMPLTGLVIDAGTMKEPGFLRCIVTAQVGGHFYRGLATAAFSPEQIKGVDMLYGPFAAEYPGNSMGGVLLITLNRPKALNALNAELLRELIGVLEEWDRGTDVRCIVLTGSERAFAAGADIKEMAPQSYMDMYKANFFADANDRISAIRKPIVAAVAGYALGGGCELAMLCDFIIAADTAKFGQPEINLGVMPGIGGTQRLTRFVGKSKAMEMCLTGRNMDAAEAERAGLVSRVVPAAELLNEAMKAAKTIAERSVPIAMMTKETVNRAYETTLSEGVRFERRVFHSMFATQDQKEGMAAFSEKRKAGFKDA